MLKRTNIYNFAFLDSRKRDVEKRSREDKTGPDAELEYWVDTHIRKESEVLHKPVLGSINPLSSSPGYI